MLNFPRLSHGIEQQTEMTMFAEQLLCGVQNDNCIIVAKGEQTNVKWARKAVAFSLWIK